MTDDVEAYELDNKGLTPGLRRHLRETIEGEFPEKVYDTTLVDDRGEEYNVEVTARRESNGVISITERDSRYNEMEPPIQDYIDVEGHNVIVKTNKIPYSLRGKLDPDRPIRDQVEERKDDLTREVVQRFVVGANYEVGVGEVTEEEKREYEEGVAYNRKQVLEDLLKIIIILGSGLSLLWLFSSQRITAKFVSATGLAANIVYGILTFIFVLGMILFLRRNKL